MSDIKIFVSHRIDLDSEIVENPLFVNVRCGATYDKRKNIDMIGDDTGDNISEKRERFCELTVQYWAWKNIESDYYGLCHYRRIMSFSKKQHEELDDFNHIVEDYFSDNFYEKYGLKKENVEAVIEQYDILSIIPMDIKKNFGKKITVYNSIKNNPNVFDIDAVDLFIKIFKSKYPEFIDDIDDYFNGHIWRAFNCYIMEREIFNKYNEMLFDVLFELEEKLDYSNYNREQYRIAGYMGECMFAIFYSHMVKTNKNLKTKELQLIKINKPQKKITLEQNNKENITIAMASSNEYVPFLSVLLESIKCFSSEKYNYEIVVINNGIRLENKNILRKSLENKNNFSIKFVDANIYLKDRELHTSMHITPMTYVRLAAIDIFRNYNKVVYLDCDVVVNEDIANLFNENIEGYMIAASRDTVMAGWSNVKDNEYVNYNRTELGIENTFDYFNAGVILININEISKHYDVDMLFDLASSKKWKWFDQDVLNKICYGKVKLLDNKWNVMSHQHDFEYQLPEFFAPKYIYDEYLEALKSPKAIHYAGRFLPCYVTNVDLSTYFWEHARNSPYYEVIIAAMIENRIGMEKIFSKRRIVEIPWKMADVLFPPKSKRRILIKKIIPKGSKRWNFFKKIYFKLIRA